MAKKAAKKEAPAAKAKKATPKAAVKAAKKAPTKKAPAKPVKAAAKPAAKSTEKEKKTVKTPQKAAAVKTAPSSAKSEKKEISKVEAKPEKKQKAAPPATVTEEVVGVPKKKEKKAKVDRTGLSEDQAKWHELHEKYSGLKAPSYSIAGQFEARTPIMHKIFGWGFILSNEYDRLEVLFEDAKRMLISNRKL